MVIAIIGAGLAGLTAGKILAEAGHEITVFEKSKGLGGRLATRYAGDNLKVKMDHGSSLISGKSASFNTFIKELQNNSIIKPWTDTYSLFDGQSFYKSHPARERIMTFFAPEGMNQIGKYLSRWVDFRNSQRVGGITLVAPDKNKKRPWIVNVADGDIYEADAVIIATPATQAQGIIQTCQNEWGIRYLVKELSKISYDPAFSSLLGYGKRDIPDWKGISCQNCDIDWISNESSKRDNDELTLVVRTTTEYATKNQNYDHAKIALDVVNELVKVLGEWAARPFWNQVHFWRYFKPVSYINQPYLELEMTNAPLALIGDYFEGTDSEAAFNSGYHLANNWLKKYKL